MSERPRTGDRVLLDCKIGRGPFSGDRVVYFDLDDGTEYSGVIPVGHCLDGNQDPFAVGRPSGDEQVHGYVEADFASATRYTIKVELPNGDLVRVHDSLVGYVLRNQPVWVPLALTASGFETA